MKKVIIFDFDGTIADTIPEFVRIINDLAKKYNFKSVEKRDIEKFRDYDVLTFFKEINLSLWKVPLVAREGKQELHKTIEFVKPIPGMKKQLQSLHKQGFTLGILTSNSKENVVKFLVKNDLELFDFVYSANNIFGKDKVIKTLLQKKKYPKQDVFYVGDESRDIDATRKVGLKMIAVTWGYNSEKALKKHNPDYLITKPEQLLKIVN